MASAQRARQQRGRERRDWTVQITLSVIAVGTEANMGRGLHDVSMPTEGHAPVFRI
jgi:hypothetical protein